MSSVAQLLRRANDYEGPSADNIDRRILDALRLFEQRPAEHLQISDLAAAANLGVTHFNLLFRECMNETPAAYMRRLRTTRARKLLEQTDLPVKAIALSNGFRDAAHFSRTFFKVCGRWPTEYRTAAQIDLGLQAKRKNRET
jgi:transcriptional regulator GlxA family with amidase domain